MQRVDHNGVVFYRFNKLADEPGLDHALFTRRGGVSQGPFTSLNLGHTVGDDLSAVQANHRRALAALGWRREDVASCSLVHGAAVGVVGLSDRGRVRSETDALVTAAPGVALLLRFADCVPLLFYDRVRRVVGLAHVGWRGVPAGVVPATVAALADSFGCRPSDLWAGVGPSIGPCCYEVGQDVVEQVSLTLNGYDPFHAVGGRVHLDLWAAVEGQLVTAGVEQICIARMCTACAKDEWFSHRGHKGKTGRFGVAIGLRELP